MPIIFAQSVIVVPGALAQFSKYATAQTHGRVSSSRARGCYFLVVRRC